MNNKGESFHFLFYTAMLILSADVIITPFDEISVFVLVAYPLFLLAAYIHFQSLKRKETSSLIVKHESWDDRKQELKNHYSDEENINYSFQECLEGIYKSSTTNNRIKRILNNFTETDKPFKIKLKRPPEDRFDMKLLNED